MKHLKFISILVALAIFLAACAPAATPTPAPTMAEPTATAMPEPTATPQPTATEAPKTIVDIAAGDGRFKTLVAALTAAGLVDTLKGSGSFTVFAPTDEAFAKLPAGTVETLLKPENKDKLVQILTYHVVAAKVMAADAAKLTSADTVAKLPLTIKADMGKVMINNATVVQADVVASNGVIHVIDSVLLPPKDIIDTAVADGRFKTLVAAVQAAGLVDTLKGKGPFTVFAPTDEAFAKLPAGTLETLLKPENKAQLAAILTYHVVAGKVMAADVVKLTLADTVNSAAVKIKVDGSKVFVNDAQVLITDIVTANGVIHVIDSVILPPKDIVDTAIADGRFKTLVAAVKAAGLVDTLKGKGPFTVFAPTDEAFAKLPKGTLETLLKPENKDQLAAILTYHVVAGKVMAADVVKLTLADTVNSAAVKIKVDGSKVFVNDAQVIITDIVTANGVIHVIDSVILPPKDIVDTAIADGRFKTLVAAVKAAGLVDTLKGKGPFTVFAPTDEAFAKLPAGTLETLLKPENKAQLAAILTYHVVAGRVMAADVVKLTTANTVNGKPITIKVDGGKVYINDAQVIITDILTSNGVIHVIDSVILPPK